ncbi:MAG: carotenoid biosynthesis protein [Hydrogenophaga sp.]|nr:carotenoid biosynthesis protein [Hydrogenophaga sp.]
MDSSRLRTPDGVALAAGLGTLLLYTAWAYPPVTLALNAASATMFAVSLWAGAVLLGRGRAIGFALLALGMGWFAEQMGSSRGWFFGHYSYTEVLGVTLGDVPVVIPMMWFALTLLGYVMASLILWRQPVLAAPGWITGGLTAWLAAMIVTAFDLGADPYFVFVLEAWIMEKKDGGWFGETLQGFVGWMLVGFAIVCLFQWRARPQQPLRSDRAVPRAALVPLALYASGLVFQVVWGHPIEVRAIACFAMGIPLFAASVAWVQWSQHGLAVRS